MDFIDEIRQFSKRVASLKDVLPTEEATKNALILPFFQLLGYDVFNPLEFMPEFTADVGIKKGERVDYAILLGGKPAILIEAKWCGDSLDKHDSQLFRYFGTTTAKFGILTNGIVYKFYTDLDEPNKMDLVPFLEFDLLNLNEGAVAELKRFSKEKIDIDAAFSAASELKYTNAIKALLNKQRTTPDDTFISFVLGEVYSGRKTQVVVEKFSPIIKKAFNAYINDVINDTLKSAMQKHEDEAKEVQPIEEPQTIDSPDRDNPDKKLFYFLRSRYYVFCATSLSDSLGMWNYYVKDGNYQGYNLKFRVSDLLDCFKPISNRRIDIFYGRVIYEEKDQINILQEVIKRIDTNIYDTIRNPAIDKKNYDVVEQEFKGELLEDLEDFRLFFKARSFSAEKEYRFVIRLPLDFEYANNDLIKTGYDMKNGLIVPFCGLKVNNRSNTLLV